MTTSVYRSGETTITLTVLLRDHEGRLHYGYSVFQDGELVAEGSDLSTGAGSPVDFDEALRALLGFADAYSESVAPGRWSAEHGVFDGRVLDDSDLALAEWFYAHGDDLPLEWRFEDLEG